MSKKLTLEILRKVKDESNHTLSAKYPADHPMYHKAQDLLENTNKAIEWVSEQQGDADVKVIINAANEIIAEFMGAHINRKRTDPDRYSGYKALKDGTVSFATSGSEKFCHNMVFRRSGEWYHNSWDWIMPVVRKIEQDHDYFSVLENIGHGVYDFSFCKYFKEDADELELPDGVLVRTDERASDFEDARLEAVYKAVLEFIQWYKQQE